ncbi:hypothetical protein H0I76_07515 [Limibaculum sp. M0105]|uniref:DUF2214 domain-containing protein n=1 Tax=Thermohalobaculum xanthum TaxID=2753746 RepID=A0A8J7M765_9RHOB|nr:hypothetical protein [Thermohalobaculum xanthum]MBK0399033.1 hypothetical protein [Thermohalobaculum xanthum]
MEGGWSFVAETGLAEWVRVSRWGYAAISGAHILGIALLVGAIVPLNLRLLGLWPSQPLGPLWRVLKPAAIAGLSLAAVCGGLLFLAGPETYARAPVFQAKMAVIAVGTLSALWFTARVDLVASPLRVRRTAAIISLSCWLSALALGRLIAFTTD